MTTEIEIPAFTVTGLVVTAAICLVAVLAGWYTVRKRVRLSQIILGIFAYVVVMLLENVLNMLGQTMGAFQTAVSYGIYVTVTVVLAREIVRYLAIRFGLKPSFQDADSSIGFALGFAGLYLFICAFYYFSLYTTATTYLSSGMEQFMADSGTDSAEALELLETIASQDGWQFIVTGINRVFYLIRDISLSVLMWYAMTDDSRKFYLGLAPLMHLIAMLPDGLYQAEIITNTYVRDIATCVLTAGIAYLAAREYNAREDQASHYTPEKLRAKKRR